MLIHEFKDLVDLNRDKVSEYLKKEYYFKRMKEELEDLGDDFEELKKFYFALGVEVRKLVIEYDINHNNISENTINIFLKQKPLTYLLSEKPDDEPIDYADTPEINNKQEKKDIKNIIKEKENEKILKNNKEEEELIDSLKDIENDIKEKENKKILKNNVKEQELIDSLKDINKKQQETINNLQEEIEINNKNNKKQLIIIKNNKKQLIIKNKK